MQAGKRVASVTSQWTSGQVEEYIRRQGNDRQGRDVANPPYGGRDKSVGRFDAGLVVEEGREEEHADDKRDDGPNTSPEMATSAKRASM